MSVSLQEISPPLEHCAGVRESKESGKGAQGATASHCQVKSSQACDAHGKLPLGKKEGEIKRCLYYSVGSERDTSLDGYTKGEESGSFLLRAEERRVDETGWSGTSQCISYNVIIFESHEGDTRSKQTKKQMQDRSPMLRKAESGGLE